MRTQIHATKVVYCQRTGARVRTTNVHENGRFIAKHIELSTPDLELDVEPEGGFVIAETPANPYFDWKGH